MADSERAPLPDFVDYVNDDGSWHVNYEYYAVPVPWEAKFTPMRVESAPMRDDLWRGELPKWRSWNVGSK